MSLGLGCALDARDTQVALADAGTSSLVGSLEPGAGAGSGTELSGVAAGSLGAACQQHTDCDAGNCVDGVCCDSSCSELCAACNLPGSEGACTAAPSDPLCPETNCQGQSSECRPLDNGQATVNCEGFGLCRANAECAAQPAATGTPCQQGTGLCDGQGACIVPNKNLLGTTCAVDDDCAEGPLRRRRPRWGARVLRRCLRRCLSDVQRCGSLRGHPRHGCPLRSRRLPRRQRVSRLRRRHHREPVSRLWPVSQRAGLRHIRNSSRACVRTHDASATPPPGAAPWRQAPRASRTASVPPEPA